MTIQGEMIIGRSVVRGTAGTVRAFNPATRAEMEPAFGLATAAEVETACALAEQAFDAYRNVPLERRAKFLETIADRIMDIGPALIERAGQALVAHPAVKAVGFTGSRQGGMALVHTASSRKEPIPVYAEMSSINPFYVLPGALAANAAKIGQGFADSLTMGVGQFCTNPGL